MKVLLTVAMLAGPSFAQGAVKSAEADAPLSDMELYQLYAEASKLHDAGRVNEAHARYQRIWGQKPGYDVAASMGDVELHRSQFAEAASHFRYALDHMPVTQNRLYLNTLQAGFSEARQHVSEVRVTTHPTTSATVSNALTGEEYLHPFYLVPGQHTLKVEAPGFASVLHEVTVVAGGTAELDVQLSSGDSPVTPVSARTVQRRYPEIVFPIGGVVAAGLGVGSVLYFVDAYDKYDELQALNLGSAACIGGGNRTSRCARADELGDQVDHSQLLGVALGAGALVAVASSVLVWWLWEDDVPIQARYLPSNNGFMLGWDHAF